MVQSKCVSLPRRAEVPALVRSQTREKRGAEQLSYGHSDGNVENKAQFIEGVMTRKAIVKSLTLSDHTIAVVGTDAIARHRLASESETDGKLTSTKIGVLQVWQKQDGTWQLLARQGFRTQQEA